jgi:ArsR family transcriptional regulator
MTGLGRGRRNTPAEPPRSTPIPDLTHMPKRNPSNDSPARTEPEGHVRSDPVYVVKARMFKALGHPIRIRILELLVDGERAVGDLQAELNIDSSGTSQHLTALRHQGLLASRRAGTNVYYRIRDPRVSQLLAVAKQILTSALADSHTLLSDLADGERIEEIGTR